MIAAVWVAGDWTDSLRSWLTVGRFTESNTIQNTIEWNPINVYIRCHILAGSMYDLAVVSRLYGFGRVVYYVITSLHM